MATYRWLTLAAAMVITVLEAWSFTAASAVTLAPGPHSAATSAAGRSGHYERGAWGSEGVRLRPAPIVSKRPRLKPHP